MTFKESVFQTGISLSFRPELAAADAPPDLKLWKPNLETSQIILNDTLIIDLTVAYEIPVDLNGLILALGLFNALKNGKSSARLIFPTIHIFQEPEQDR